jgi:ribosomal protein S18 acetylase RimI-like enzyme
MAVIRPFRPGDEDALAAVCLATAAAGSDGSGILTDDGLWADLYLLPYLARHPDLAFVAEDADARPAGYVVATDDTIAFDAWFARHWWPATRARYAHPDANARQWAIVAEADARTESSALRATHPAHLHIDLLPVLQGQGTGRRLVETLVEALRERGVRGLHLGADAQNAGALAFYDRLGFARAASPEGAQLFTLDL